MKKILSLVLSISLCSVFLFASYFENVHAQENSNVPDPKEVLDTGVQVESSDSMKELASKFDKEAVTFIITQENNSLFRSGSEGKIVTQTVVNYLIPKNTSKLKGTNYIEAPILSGSFTLYGTITYSQFGNSIKLLSGNGGYKRGDVAFRVDSQRITYGMASAMYNYTDSLYLGTETTFSFTCPSSWPYVTLEAVPHSIGYVHCLTASHGAVYTSEVHNEVK